VAAEGLTEQEILDYAKWLVKKHQGIDVEYLSVWEMFPDYTYGTPRADHELTEEEARKVDSLISKATIEVTWP
jgi:hypothetical protein